MRALFYFVFGFGLSWTAFAQQATPPSGVDPVPDYVAFRLFFAAVAESSSPSPAEALRQESRLKPIQLAMADKAVLVGALSTFKTNFANARLTPAKSLNAVAETTLAELIARMSPEGFQKLYAYVRMQKRYMGVVPAATKATQ